MPTQYEPQNKHISALIKRLLAMPAVLEKRDAQIIEIEKQMKALEKAGLIYAVMHFRAKKYCILVYPMKNGERPNPTYVGADTAKIEEANNAILRGKQYDKLKNELEELHSLIREAVQDVGSLERLIKF